MRKISVITAAIILFALGCGKPTPDYAWYKNAAFIKAVNVSDTEKATGILYTSKIDLKPLNKDGQSVLVYALENTEDPDIIEAIAHAGADLTATNEAGRTPLRIAARSVRNQKVLLALLRSGASVQDKDNLLADAEQNPNPQVKQILLEAINKIPWYKSVAFTTALKAGNADELFKELPFVDVNAKDKNNTTALLATLVNPQADAIKLILKHTTDVNAKYKNTTPVLFMAVAQIQDPAIYKALFDAGVFINDTDETGTTALMNLVSKNGNALALAKFFMDSGADVNIKNKEGNTALMYAVRNRTDTNLALLLIKYKADVNAVNSDGQTALHLAARYNPNDHLVQELVNAGAALEATDKEGNTPLILSAYNDNNLVAQVLLQAGAKTDAKNKDGKTALALAAQLNKNPKVAMAILNSSAKVDNPKAILALAAMNKNPEVKDYLAQLMPYKASAAASDAKASSNSANAWYKSSAFSDAVTKNNLTALKKVLSGGINLNAMQPGKIRISGLMFAAARSNSADIIYTLIKAGADVNIRNESGDTALSVAALVNENPKVIAALISAGADVNSRDNDGISVLAVAAANNKSEEVMMTLLKNGAKGTKSVMLKYAEKNSNKRIKEILENGLD